MLNTASAAIDPTPAAKGSSQNNRRKVSLGIVIS
jgi:hypothetical protein